MKRFFCINCRSEIYGEQVKFCPLCGGKPTRMATLPHRLNHCEMIRHGWQVILWKQRRSET